MHCHLIISNLKRNNYNLCENKEQRKVKKKNKRRLYMLKQERKEMKRKKE